MSCCAAPAQKQGLYGLAEIKEIQWEEELVEALKLKPGKAKLVLDRIAKWQPEEPPPSPGASRKRGR